uniref:DM domain-containing protein n=1 Tax=Branchiostoma floridae TaxID=7739 RepID=C3Y8P8_BRAFL|eukprot:XP_002607475.1 hypothetical protein BRAFLDRAFT_69907 [Branchiostoma floridae]
MSGTDKREYTCKRCRVHGVVVAVKGHKRQCHWKYCQCPGCQQVTSYRQEHASEINAKREVGSDMSVADVINIANFGRSIGATKPTSTSAKRREKQVGYNPRPEEAVAGPSSEFAPFQVSDSESRQMPPPSSSDQAGLDLDSDVNYLVDMFPGAKENLGLSSQGHKEGDYQHGAGRGPANRNPGGTW